MSVIKNGIAPGLRAAKSVLTLPFQKEDTAHRAAIYVHYLLEYGLNIGNRYLAIRNENKRSNYYYNWQSLKYRA